MNRYATEFAGTFFLVLVIGLCLVHNPALAPLATGAVLVALVYMGGPISGAHYNPAISVAVHLCGHLDLRDCIIYMITQLSGAVLAALTVPLLTGEFAVMAPAAPTTPAVALAAETIFTCALTLVILNVAYAPRRASGGFHGVAIGCVVMGGAFAVGPISGGAFNPAVGTGPILVALAEGGTVNHLWIYWVGPLAGALLTVPLHRFQHAQ